MQRGGPGGQRRAPNPQRQQNARNLERLEAALGITSQGGFLERLSAVEDALSITPNPHASVEDRLQEAIDMVQQNQPDPAQANQPVTHQQPDWDAWFTRLIDASDPIPEFNHVPDRIRHFTDSESRATSALVWVEKELGISGGEINEGNFVSRCRTAIQRLATWEPPHGQGSGGHPASPIPPAPQRGGGQGRTSTQPKKPGFWDTVKKKALDPFS